MRHTGIFPFIYALCLLCGLISPIEAADASYFTGSLLSLGSIPLSSGRLHYFTGQIQTRGSLATIDGHTIAIEPGTLFAGYFVYDASLPDTQEYHHGIGHYRATPNDQADVDALPAFSLTFQMAQGLLTLASTGSFEALVDASNPDLHSFWAYWDNKGRDLELRLEDESARALSNSRLPKAFVLPAWTRADVLIPTGLLGSLERIDTHPTPPGNLQTVPVPDPIDPSLAWTFPRQGDGTPLRDLAGYRVCCGLQAHFDADTCSEPVDVDVEPHKTSLQLKALMPGRTYYCAVQSHDLAGHRSPPSPIVSIWTGTY